MTDEQKRRPQNTKTWRKDEGKSIGHQRAVCLGIKEDKSNQWQEMFMGEMCVGEMYYLDPEGEEPTLVTLH